MTGPVSAGLVPVGQIRFHPRNVRRDLGDLRDLAESIRRVGLIQPVVVERHPDYLLLRAGHRRVAAARLAGVVRVPAVVHADHLSTEQFLVQALHENLHRAALDPVDRARAITDLKAAGRSTAELARELGVTPNTVRAWALPADPGPGETPAPSTPDAQDEHRPATAAPPVQAVPAPRPRSAQSVAAAARARVHRELPALIERWEPAVDSDWGLDPAALRQLLDELRALLHPDSTKEAAA